MKIAIVHDWLTVYAGAERCLEQMLECFPDADLFALIDSVPEKDRAFLKGKTPKTSFLQKLPFAKTKYRAYLPLMPFAIEQFDLSDYDVVLTSSHAVAKGVLTGPDQLHISYTYSPIRYAWDLQFQYLTEAGLSRGLRSVLVRWLLHRIRIWDARTSAGVDHFVAISHFIGRRIRKVYRRDADVIYPPVDLDHFDIGNVKSNFYVTAGRMVPYKKVPLIIEAFATMPDKELIVIGTGPEWEKCRAAAGSNVTLLGWQSSESLRDHLQRAKAFVFAAEEDFGIAPLEAQACGTPVIAFNKGGATETLRGLDATQPTATFFDAQTPAAICSAVEQFEANAGRMTAQFCRENAMRFSVERFRNELVAFVQTRWAAYNDGAR
ncbi:glycosyltransferase family 4 protein [Sphingopyxis sp.]|uniref:glycosyltransferase family 4 protein n=1 Tax=Sphingopyxis sp. TaxID=1908224 RepID=UPI003D11FAD0